MFQAFPFSWFHHARLGHVATLGSNNASVDIAVNSFFANREKILVRGHDVVTRLSFADAGMNQGADIGSFRFS